MHHLIYQKYPALTLAGLGVCFRRIIYRRNDADSPKGISPHQTTLEKTTEYDHNNGLNVYAA